MSLINSTKHWLQNADSLKLNMTIFLDLKKAFDIVDHKTLIDLLVKYGIRGKERDLFYLYFSGKNNFVLYMVKGQ